MESSERGGGSQQAALKNLPGREHTMTREVKEGGQVFDWAAGMARIGESGAGIAQLIEERMDHGVDS